MWGGAGLWDRGCWGASEARKEVVPGPRGCGSREATWPHLWPWAEDTDDPWWPRPAGREGSVGTGARHPLPPPSEYHWSDLTGTQRPREPVTQSVRLQSRAWRVDLEGQRPCPARGCEGRGPHGGPQCLDVTQALPLWQHAEVCWVQWPEVLGPPAERQTGRRSS